jgi:hypothetical protein
MKDLRCLVGSHRWLRSHVDGAPVGIVCQRCGKREDGPDNRRINLG